MDPITRLEIERRIKQSLEDYLKYQYTNERKSTREIGEELGVSHRSIGNWLREFNIQIRSNNRLPPDFIKPSKKQLEQLYLYEGKNLNQIAENIGVSSLTVRNWLSYYKIAIRSRLEAKLPLGFKRPSKELLKKWYLDEDKSTNQIGKELGVSGGAIINWLKEYGIPIRTNNLPLGFKKPSKEQLKIWYTNERKSANEIAKQLGVSGITVNRWLNSHNIAIRSNSENRLPEGFKKPSKKQLERLYVRERKSTVNIASGLGVRDTTVGKWLKEYGVPIRDFSASRLPEGVKSPTKEELEILYIKEGKSMFNISKELRVSEATVRNWIKKYGISIKYKYEIQSNEQFIELLKRDETARNLAAAALNHDGINADIEHIILAMYDGKFKSANNLHKLLNDNSDEVYKLIKSGLTNLGYYIGGFALQDRTIIPILIDQAIFSIPEEMITEPLEYRLIRILRTDYSPRFNQAPEATLIDIKEKAINTKGKKKRLYNGLYNHYNEVQKLSKELK